MAMVGRAVVNRADASAWTVAGQVGETYILEETGGAELRAVPVDRFDAEYIESELEEPFT